ncbi:MAG: ExbD/TolR family protein [Cystobacterineae bacterium]|nr:ExbD/TolR family protein [Cystobacterineae bacterium]
MSPQQRPPRTTLSEINVTPMVDVMLVLLIIFMVTAPLIQPGVKIDLPQTRALPLESDEAKLILSINKQEQIFLGETQIPYEQLEDKLRTNDRLKHEKELFLQADKTLPYAVVLDIMAIAQRAGVDKLGMITDPRSIQRSNKKPPPTQPQP